MIKKVKLITLEEYNLVLQRGYQPLIDPLFDIEINLRVSIQKSLFGHTIFGRGNIPQANQRFYEWVFNHKPNICEESLKPLHHYSASFVSHILSRGAHPEMAHDPRNINILFTTFHNQWEDETRNKFMYIWKKNQLTIRTLKNEYSSLSWQNY